MAGKGCCLFQLLPSHSGYTGPDRPCPRGYSANHVSPLSFGLVHLCAEGGPAPYGSAPLPPSQGHLLLAEASGGTGSLPLMLLCLRPTSCPQKSRVVGRL